MEEKIKILWISTVAPCSKSPAAGGQTFNYYFKAFCLDDNFEVRLISLGDDRLRDKIEKENRCVKHDISYPKDRASDFRKIYNIESEVNPFTRYAGMISNYCATVIIGIAKKYAKDGYTPDVVIFEWTNTVVLAPDIHKIFPNSKLFASEHDVAYVGLKRKAEYYKGFKSILWNIKYKHEKKVELNALKMCSVVLPQNSDNMDILIGEGIESKRLQWLVPYFNNMQGIKRAPCGKDILFFGAMARPENYLSAIWFIENVMPLLSDSEIRFVVLGSNPNEKLQAYKSEKVIITGFVDAIEPYFEDSLCLVAPLVLGAGIKVKILEALSSGIPVLTNKIGIEGIPAKNGENYIHCETAKEYADAIEDIITGNVDVNKIGMNALSFIKDNYSVEDSLNNYKARIIQEVEGKMR